MEIWFPICQFKMKEYKRTILIVQIIHYFSRKYIFDNYRTFHNFRAQNLHWKLQKIYRIYVIFVKSIYAFIKKVYVLSRIMFLSNFQPFTHDVWMTKFLNASKRILWTNFILNSLSEQFIWVIFTSHVAHMSSHCYNFANVIQNCRKKCYGSLHVELCSENDQITKNAIDP